MRVLVFLLLALSAIGQDVVPTRRGNFRSSALISPPTPPQIATGLKYWWVSSDMVTKIIVTNWVDRIQGNTWTNISTATTCPTNSSLGVHFTRTASQQLTNAIAAGINASGDGGNFDTNSWWFVIRLDSSGSCDVLSQSSSHVVLGFTGTSPYAFNTPNIVSDGSVGTGKTVDIGILSQSSSGHSFPSITIYTNGIAAKVGTTTSIGQTMSVLLLGGDSDNGFLDGYLSQVAVYSNVLTAANFVSLHTYRTNLDGGSP